MEVSESKVDVPNSMDEINSLEDMKLFEEELNSLEDMKSLDDMKPLDEIQSLGEQMDFKQEIVDSLTDPQSQEQQQQPQEQHQLQQQPQHQPQQQHEQLFPIIKDENVDNESVIECRQCGVPGNSSSKLIQCSTCCKHFHAACAGAGAGSGVFNETNWNCTQCQGKCQICHQQTTEIEGGRALRCEECQKLYHATCMRPMMTSIPKFGWKCNQCRVCSDCGSRTPGAGISSRWHCHFTVCDSCYQQRNKGFSCPMCQRAYRAAAHKEMVKCSACNRFVHSTCDEAADLQQYHAHKESNPDYDYVCPACKALPAKGSATLEERNDGPSTSSSGPSVSTGSSTSDTSADNVTKSSTADLVPVTKCGPGKPGDLYKLVKKRLGRGGKFMPSKSSGTLAPISRKRGAPRGKGRNALIFADKIQQGLDRNGKDLDYLLSGGATDSKPIFISDKDEYMMTHDICVMCGSIGKGEDGILIGCAQCGQCYHPYCVNVKVNKVVLERGWRCLDCTICEGCGQKNDEARLILCDECDISYHIYCIEPPLETVPHGNWKCSWCAVCQQCGRKDSGKNSEWMNGFTECGPCASEGNCSVCSKAYVEDELIIECVNCERWLHGQCDGINTGEEAAVKCENDDYNCPLCRRLERLEMPPPPTSANQQHSTDGATATPKNGGASPCVPAAQAEHNGKAEHWLDGVCVSEQGFQHIKSLSNEIKRKRKVQQRTPNEPQQQDFGIQATIESVVAAGADNNSSYDDNASNCQNESTADNKVTPPPNYKDGMPWTGAPDAAAPEGFSIFKNDAGVSILRKKRQRNLQKVGIGGFTVRNRAVKKEPLVEITAGGNAGEGGGSSGAPVEKKKKAARPKNRNKLIEAFPPYLQEAFFGKELLMNCKTDVDFWESDPETAEDELSKLEFTSGTIIKTEPPNSASDSAALSTNPTIKTEHIKTEAPSMPAENQQADADAYLVNTDEMHKQYMENMAQVPMEADHIKSETPDIQNSSTSSANLTNTTVMSSNTGANNSGVMDTPEISFEPQSQPQTGALEAQVEAQAGPGPNMVENSDMLH